MIRALFLSFFGLYLVGCTTITTPVTDYTLALPDRGTDASAGSKSSLTLKMAGTKTIPSLSSKGLLYLTDHQEVGEYLYSRWSDVPSALIDRSLAASINDSNLFSTLIPKTSTVNADLLLESSLSSFYHRIHEDKTSDAYIDITYLLIDQKTKKIIASKRFTITSPAPSMDAHGGVTALNNATHALSNQCIAWLNLTMKENKWIK
ncbi:MAG: ABC-type transport auxiliary lipoprotein family protein [Sulfuricurvum sp.]|jgi:cholesterol transport system auxiliary component